MRMDERNVCDEKRDQRKIESAIKCTSGSENESNHFAIVRCVGGMEEAQIRAW